MLTIPGKKHPTCAGSRREFLRIGGLAMGGMALPQVLAAEARAGVRNSHKAVIMVYLTGGPPHIDMVDMKPEAPGEIRGHFRPIETNVSGVQLVEHMPELARQMHRLAIVRSVVGLKDEHASNQSLCGYTIGDDRERRIPSLGAVASRLFGPVDRAVPPFVDLRVPSSHRPYSNEAHPGFLGLGHAAVHTHGPLMQDMTLQGITLGRLANRRRVLRAVDRFRRAVDDSGMLNGLDEVNARAFDILTDSRLVRAMDLSQEDPRTLERYGKGSPTPMHDASPQWNEQFLMARRLVEAGARCVTLGFGSWDFHSPSLEFISDQIRKLDRALAALVGDLHDRGLDKDVTVIAWGEFGRSPRLGGYMGQYAAAGGREHWPAVSMAILAGGGMRTGQVIGATNRFGEYADERPVHFRDIHATLYHNMGINLETTELRDSEDRPHYLLPGHTPVHELI